MIMSLTVARFADTKSRREKDGQTPANFSGSLWKFGYPTGDDPCLCRGKFQAVAGSGVT